MLIIALIFPVSRINIDFGLNQLENQFHLQHHQLQLVILNKTILKFKQEMRYLILSLRRKLQVTIKISIITQMKIIKPNFKMTIMKIAIIHLFLNLKRRKRN